MSTYRRLSPSLPSDNDGRSDVYAVETMKTASNQKQSQRACVALDECKYLRKCTPANIPLPRTLKWFEGLPPPVRPAALMRQFARIANLIAVAWDDLEHFETYMDSLLTDKRGGRKGFPTDVVAELSALDVYRNTQECTSPWDGVSKRR